MALLLWLQYVEVLLHSWTQESPLKAPVGGAAMGLIKEGKEVRILTDIQGIEDFLGDMDFKVAGKQVYTPNPTLPPSLSKIVVYLTDGGLIPGN